MDSCDSLALGERDGDEKQRMKFERLRVAGFKSFCDPTEFKIEPGLTGVVGPNGCGKSNLVEAMRWVMALISRISLYDRCALSSISQPFGWLSRSQR